MSEIDLTKEIDRAYGHQIRMSDGSYFQQSDLLEALREAVVEVQEDVSDIEKDINLDVNGSCIDLLLARVEALENRYTVAGPLTEEQWRKYGRETGPFANDTQKSCTHKQSSATPVFQRSPYIAKGIDEKMAEHLRKEFVFQPIPTPPADPEPTREQIEEALRKRIIEAVERMVVCERWAKNGVWDVSIKTLDLSDVLAAIRGTK